MSTADRDALSNAPNHCVKSVSIRSYSGLHFPAYGYGKILRIPPYSARMRENADQNNSEYVHLLRSEYFNIFETLP